MKPKCEQCPFEKDSEDCQRRIWLFNSLKELYNRYLQDIIDYDQVASVVAEAYDLGWRPSVLQAATIFSGPLQKSSEDKEDNETSASL